jgi:hypothetical protein
MANKINNRTPAPQFPWDVRYLVRPKELERPGKVKRKGDPKNPALASMALMDFISPAHNADELRLPLPPTPEGHDADLAAHTDREQLESFVGRSEEAVEDLTERAFQSIRAAGDRMDRLRALLGREQQMLKVVRQVQADIEEIDRKRKDETKDEGY